MHGYGLSHSDGAKRPNTNKQHDTTKYATPRNSQTYDENGDMNENVDGGSFPGF